MTSNLKEKGKELAKQETELLMDLKKYKHPFLMQIVNYFKY